jgi:hypothetical protein
MVDPIGDTAAMRRRVRSDYPPVAGVAVATTVVIAVRMRVLNMTWVSRLDRI